MNGRQVTLVLCTPDGEILGRLTPFDVPSSHWQQVADVVQAAAALYGIDVTVLRLLQTQSDGRGGPVSYLAEVADRPDVDLAPYVGSALEDSPLRLSYARPGGHRADLRWAEEVLRRCGTPLLGSPRQMRTWNLSSIWMLPTATGSAWLKVVPPFFAHEAAVMPLLDPAITPRVLGASPGRVLIADVPGDDQYDASGAPLLEMVRLLIRLQVGWIRRTDELMALEVPDLRPAAAMPKVRAVANRHRDAFDPGTRQRLDELIRTMGERWAEIDACGLPNTLVHGDYHPGNVRARSGSFKILDWGDCGVGHPMLDQLPFVEHLTAVDRGLVEQEWAYQWATAVPGCDARRAAELLRPIASLYRAVSYQRFLDNIEPDEHCYHAGDPQQALREATELAQ